MPTVDQAKLDYRTYIMDLWKNITDILDQDILEDLLPEIDQAAYEQIRAHARKLYRKAQQGYRGQQVTIHDTLDYWVMVATREFFLTTQQDSSHE